MEENAFQVTFHTELLPDMRWCPNLGCKMVLFMPSSIVDVLCPLCYAHCQWQVDALQYTIRKV